MVTFEITSQQEVEIGGIGRLPAGETVHVTEEQARAFEVAHGYQLSKAVFPASIVVTAITPNKVKGGE